MPDPTRDKGRPTDSLASTLLRTRAEELFSFLRKHLRSLHDAEDLFQTVFERVIKLKNADLVEQPEAYLFGIAHHVVREHWIREKRGAEFVEFNSPAVEAADTQIEHARADDEHDVNLQRQLDRALERLPELHRFVLLACKRDGMTYEEAGAALGMSPEMVHKYLVQAKAKIMAMAWDW